MTKAPKVCLLTGLPDSFLARRLLDLLLLEHPELNVLCLIDEGGYDQAHEQLSQLTSRDRQRVEFVRGDVSAMDFGLSGAGYLDLAARIDVIHHCVCASQGGMARESERRHFIHSTGEVLELATARGSRVSRVIHWSSTRLFTPQSGRVTESESSCAVGPRSRDDDARFRAELLMREFMKRVPITILRPSTIVGDSRTGEMDRSEPAYALLQLIVNSPRDLRLPMPGSGEQPCHFVPIDYVVEAGLNIADNPNSIGRTFHIVDERPTSLARALDLINETAERSPAPAGLTRNISALLFSAPRIERFGHVPRSFLELLAGDVFYDSRNTRELLSGTGIECPALTSYLPLMVKRVKREQQPSARPPRRPRRDPRHEELDDPLDV
jgi:nucleoside-diphosphate-sugar epimerase